MKKAVIATIVLVLLIPFNVNSQSKSNDPIILTIDNQNVTKSDFLRIYSKNNSQAKPDRKSIQEYMDMFINYKLKVIEAEHLGFDTASSFLKEFSGYRDQLAKPYLTDTLAEDKLLRDIYSRMLVDVKIRQMFVKANQFATAEDTLKAYNKLIDARTRLLKGEPWDSVLLTHTEDAYSKRTMGVIGYFTAFQMYPAIENAAYNLKLNETSMPIRTRIGYSIVQVLDRRPSRGELKVAHIMIAFPENASRAAIDSAGDKINDIYKRILAGENFSELAKKYSDDKRSAAKGGETNWFGVGQMIPEFENVAYSLKKDGDVSAPLKTSFGWHIIKRIGSRPMRSYNDSKEFIRQKIQSDDRAKVGRNALVAKVKMEIGFKDDPSKARLLMPLMDSSIFKGKWNPDKAKDMKSNILFNIKNTSYSLKDFADFLGKTQRPTRSMPYYIILDNVYNEFVKVKIMDFENGRLDQLYPEFKFLVQEYHDGILLFNLMEDKIWTKAARDTIGLEKFYQEHKDQYKWGERLRALLVTAPKKQFIDEAYKMAEDYNSGKVKVQDILNKVCNHDSTKSCISVTDTLFEKGDNLILDSIGWKPGVSSIILKDGKYGYFVKKLTVAPELKKLQDVKGVCIADYQAYLEKLYLEELHKKYKIVINQKLLDNI